jgi:hypothetical protein
MCPQSGQWHRYVSQGGVDTVRYKGVCWVGLRSALEALGTSAILGGADHLVLPDGRSRYPGSFQRSAWECLSGRSAYTLTQSVSPCVTTRSAGTIKTSAIWGG